MISMYCLAHTGQGFREDTGNWQRWTQGNTEAARVEQGGGGGRTKQESKQGGTGRNKCGEKEDRVEQ